MSRASMSSSASPALSSAAVKRAMESAASTVSRTDCGEKSVVLAWPRYFFGLIWLSIFFICEPLCGWAGRRSVLTGLARGDWRTVAALCGASLICGFFWEMWNINSDPKWIYHVPGVGFWHVFEMPVLGYLGYFPFAMELYLFANLCLPKWARPRLSSVDRD